MRSCAMTRSSSSEIAALTRQMKGKHVEDARRLVQPAAEERRTHAKTASDASGRGTVARFFRRTLLRAYT